MKFFPYYSDVPIDFEGHCYISGVGVQMWYKKGRHYHREDGPAVEFKKNRYDDSCYNVLLYHSQYYISGQRFESEQYWKQPIVIKTVLDKINSLNPRGETI